MCSLKEGFLWGGATASYQCEGAWNEDGRVPSLWDVYLHENGFENGDVASDHYHRYKEDVRLMRDGGHNAYRFSLAWPRLIIDRQGNVNQKGVQFYHNLIDELLANGIQPHVTIFHWDLPQYLEEIGGWLNREIVGHYLKLCELVFREYGGKVKYWTTFNEPRFYTLNGYRIGNYPPGLQDTQKLIEASYLMMLASARAVELFRKMGMPGQIGVVHSYQPVFGVDNAPATQKAMRYADNFYNNWVLDTAALGEIPADLLSDLKERGYSVDIVQEADLPVFKNNIVDFVGLNYYAGALVQPWTEGETVLRWNNKGKGGTSQFMVKGWFEVVSDPNIKQTDWGTPIYPQGLYYGIMRAWQKYHLPIYITENGIGMYEDISAEKPQDDARIEFLNNHVDAIGQSMEKGADVRGYFTWSTMDLYSWKNGHEKRYGLIAVDFVNGCERKTKASYDWFKKVCEENGKNIERRKSYD